MTYIKALTLGNSTIRFSRLVRTRNAVILNGIITPHLEFRGNKSA
jgi:hypothetical protein